MTQSEQTQSPAELSPSLDEQQQRHLLWWYLAMIIICMIALITSQPPSLTDQLIDQLSLPNGFDKAATMAYQTYPLSPELLDQIAPYIAFVQHSLSLPPPPPAVFSLNNPLLQLPTPPSYSAVPNPKLVLSTRQWLRELFPAALSPANRYAQLPPEVKRQLIDQGLTEMLRLSLGYLDQLKLITETLQANPDFLTQTGTTPEEIAFFLQVIAQARDEISMHNGHQFVLTAGFTKEVRWQFTDGRSRHWTDLGQIVDDLRVRLESIDEPPANLVAIIHKLAIILLGLAIGGTIKKTIGYR